MVKHVQKWIELVEKMPKKVKQLVKLSNFDQTYHVTTHYIDGISPTTISWLRGRYL